MLFHLLHFAFNKSSKGATSKQSLSLMYVHWSVSATKLQREGRVDVYRSLCGPFVEQDNPKYRVSVATPFLV